MGSLDSSPLFAAHAVSAWIGQALGVDVVNEIKAKTTLRTNS
jgi:hypothetical protein